MRISKMYMRRLAILVVLFALSVGMVAANSGVNESNKTSSNAGTNIIGKVSSLGANSTDEDEWVKITNIGTSNIDFTGWKLMNRENLAYAFPNNFVLKPGAQVKVHTIAGKANSTDLYGSLVPFNKTGDTAILKDDNGKVISERSYPVVSTKKPKIIKSAVKPNVAAPKVIKNKATNTKATKSNATTNSSNVTTKTSNATKPKVIKSAVKPNVPAPKVIKNKATNTKATKSNATTNSSNVTTKTSKGIRK
jgi:hypothetical protein